MQHTKRLLLVENDAAEMAKVRRAFERLGSVETLTHVLDTTEAWQCLSCDSQNRPSLIVLDLDTNWPEGIDFLRTIKNDPALQCIPIVVMTSSHQSDPMLDSFAAGVAGYIIKPDDETRLLETIEAFDRYWTLSRVPTHLC